MEQKRTEAEIEQQQKLAKKRARESEKKSEKGKENGAKVAPKKQNSAPKEWKKQSDIIKSII